MPYLVAAASVRVTGDMVVEGGGLPGRYRTAEFHFHWGSREDVGSEHAMDGVKYPLEVSPGLLTHGLSICPLH